MMYDGRYDRLFGIVRPSAIERRIGLHPTVSVVIPFYNDPYINEAIDSVLAQTYRPIEIVVVDDGSSRYADRILPAYAGRVRYVAKANGGTASALNAGIRVSSGTYVAWLSSDDRFRPDKIERQLGYMIERQASICCTDFAVIDGSGRLVASRYGEPYPDGLALMRLLATTNAINGCTIMMRRDIFDIVGVFNESLKYTQDYDFWARVVLSGIRIDYLALPLTEYRMHDAMGTVVNNPGLMAEYDSLRAFYGSRLAGLFAEGGTFG